MQLQADVHARRARVNHLPAGLDVLVDGQRGPELDRVDRGGDKHRRPPALPLVFFFVFFAAAPAAARAAGGAVEVVQGDGAGEGVEVLEDAADADSVPALFLGVFL